MTADTNTEVTLSDEERAAEQGAADAAEGRAMSMRYWGAPEPVRDAYARAYQRVMNPPKPRKPRPKRMRAEAAPPIPKDKIRVWKQPPS